VNSKGIVGILTQEIVAMELWHMGGICLQQETGSNGQTNSRKMIFRWFTKSMLENCVQE
jgi:hypothetical protein